MNPVPILEAKNLTKKFGGVIAVKDVSITVNKGDFTGIIGPNGSGKTTLVNLITGFVKLTSGEVKFMNKIISGQMPHKIVDAGIARTFQMVRPFYNLPAYKNVIIPLYSPRVKRRHGGKYGNRDAVALDLLEEVGFERDSHVAYKEAGTMPQGYLKRLELAKALALEPELLILDELFSGLSLAEVSSVIPIIDKVHRSGVTIIMIEHRLKELFRIANKVIVLDQGAKIAEGSPKEVMGQDQVKNAYLGTEE